MAQLPLNLDLPTMQSKWKSILDPVVAQSSSPLQFLIGPVQNLDGTVPVNVLSPPTNTLVVGFTATGTGYYEISTTGFQMYNSVSASELIAQIVTTSGAPLPVQGITPKVHTTSVATFGDSGDEFTYKIVSYWYLTAGASYVFKLYGQTSTGTLTFRFSDNPAAFIVKQVSQEG